MSGRKIHLSKIYTFPILAQVEEPLEEQPEAIEKIAFKINEIILRIIGGSTWGICTCEST